MYARIEVAEDRDAIRDSDLLRYFRRGDQSALDVLMERHRDALFRFCYHLTGNREDAEDVCQETLARAMTRVSTLQSDSAFRSWLFSIARNLSIDTHRRKKRTVTMPDDEAMPIQLFTEEPIDRVEVEEEHQTVVEAMGKLAQSHQRVLVLREVEGMSYAAIAEQLDVSQSAVETLLFRARRRLKEEYHKSAAPALALLAGLRELIFKAGGPVVGGTVAKLALTAAMVGSMALTVPHSHFTFPQVPSASGSTTHGAIGTLHTSSTTVRFTGATTPAETAFSSGVYSPRVSSLSQIALTAPVSPAFSSSSPVIQTRRTRNAATTSRQMRKGSPSHMASQPQHGPSQAPPPPSLSSSTGVVSAPVSAPVAPVSAPTQTHVKWVPAVVQRSSVPAQQPAPTSEPPTPQPTSAPVATNVPAPAVVAVVASTNRGHEGKAKREPGVESVPVPSALPGAQPSFYVGQSSSAGTAPASTGGQSQSGQSSFTGQGPGQSANNLPPGQAKKYGVEGSGRPGHGHHK